MRRKMSNKSGKPEPKSRNSLPRSASTLSDDAKVSEKSTASAASSVTAMASTVVSTKVVYVVHKDMLRISDIISQQPQHLKMV